MKISNFKYLAKATLLPLTLIIFSTTEQAGAEQIDRFRGRNTEFIPSVTDLNLSIPKVRGKSSAIVDRSISERSSQHNSNRKKIDSINLKTTVTTEQPIEAKSIRRRSLNTTNLVSAPAKSTRNRQVVLANTDSLSSVKDSNNSRSKSSTRQKIATAASPPLGGNYLRLVRDSSKGFNDNGNPIYTLEAYIDGKIYQTFNAVSGVATSQKLDRNIGNNHAPLPDGLYDVSNQVVPGAVAEVGKTFIGIYPKFETGRTDLGIHIDPSFNKQNGSDGTSGCIGLTTSADRDAINEFVLKYRPRNLFVSILTNGNNYLTKK